MPSLNTKKIWDIGTPLSVSWVSFADDESKKQFADAPTFSTLAAKFTDHSSPIDGQRIIQLFSEQAAMSEAHRQLAETMKEDLLERLFNSELRATGYLESVRPARAPIFIDPTHFDNCIPNWKLSTIFADGREWSRVRVSDHLPEQKTFARGSGPAIRAAITQLLCGELDLCSMPRKAAAQEVRKKLGINSSGGNGLSDVNLAKYIVEACGIKAI